MGTVDQWSSWHFAIVNMSKCFWARYWTPSCNFYLKSEQRIEFAVIPNYAKPVFLIKSFRLYEPQMFREYPERINCISIHSNGERWFE